MADDVDANGLNAFERERAERIRKNREASNNSHFRVRRAGGKGR